jgi:hypothetical protein
MSLEGVRGGFFATGIATGPRSISANEGVQKGVQGLKKSNEIGRNDTGQDRPLQVKAHKPTAAKWKSTSQHWHRLLDLGTRDLHLASICEVYNNGSRRVAWRQQV